MKDLDEPLAFWRGFLCAAVICIPLWGCIGIVIWKIAT